LRLFGRWQTFKRRMKTIYLTTVLLLVINLAIGQQDTIISETTTQIQSTHTWRGACCDKNGKPLNPGDAISQVYSVRKFKSKTPLEINLKSVKIGTQTISLDINYKEKIEGDTKIIRINGLPCT
jgi:hypothetical protein